MAPIEQQLEETGDREAVAVLRIRPAAAAQPDRDLRAAGGFRLVAGLLVVVAVRHKSAINRPLLVLGVPEVTV